MAGHYHVEALVVWYLNTSMMMIFSDLGKGKAKDKEEGNNMFLSKAW